jgi:hypothetical protein
MKLAFNSTSVEGNKIPSAYRKGERKGKEKTAT